MTTKKDFVRHLTSLYWSKKTTATRNAAHRWISEEHSTQWERWDYVNGKTRVGTGEAPLSPVPGDRWRCGTVKQLEVNLCRVEIAELWAAIKSISYFSSAGNQQHLFRHGCASTDIWSLSNPSQQHFTQIIILAAICNLKKGGQLIRLLTHYWCSVVVYAQPHPSINLQILD